jgi:RecJ-like exonuclease
LKAFCISHSKDVDGICSAALAVAATNCLFRLTDYDSILKELESVGNDVTDAFVCDIGTDPVRFPELLASMERLAKRAKVTYIDHHYLRPEWKGKIRKAGVVLVHDTKEAAGMLTFKNFEKSLPEDAKLLALYASVTDYMDNSSLSKQLMENFDRHYVLLESVLLSYAVARKGDAQEFRDLLVTELSKMTPPHRIRKVPEYALEQAEQTIVLAELVRTNGERMRRIAHMETEEHSTGAVAKLLIGAFGVPVGVSYRPKDKGRWYEVSLRGTSQCKVHLGQMIATLAAKFGGNGGGHKLAAGCRIPREKIDALLQEIDRLV